MTLGGGHEQLAICVVDTSAVDPGASGPEFMDACQNTVGLIIAELPVGEEDDQRLTFGFGALPYIM